eukprot:scaffold40748_cov62-Phaeocystis_antarctica.AAC.1
MANFGGRYTCPDCDVDGGRGRATCGSRVQGRRVSAWYECIRTGHRCTLGCAKTPGSAEQTRLRRKSARAVPAARPLSARTPRDAKTTRGCAGCCSAECAAQAEAMTCFKIKQVLGVS